MAQNRDELNRRRAAREAQRRKREAERRKLMRRLAAAVLVLAAAAVGLFFLTGRSDEAPASEPSQTTLQTTAPETSAPAQTDPTVQTEAATQAPPATEPPAKSNEPTTVIHLAAAGDLVVSDSTVEAGAGQSGYDYSQVFLDVAPVFAQADLSLLNFEGNLVGAPYGTESLSAPQELAQALKNMGVDLVQLANSSSVTHGVKGLVTTLNNVRQAGLEPLGVFASAEEFQRAKGYTIVEVQGIRIALVAFTKGVGGLSLPAGSEDCVNLLYTDYATTYQKIDKEGITDILSNVAVENPDLTIALVHWGSEYKDMVTKGQKDIAALMQKNGVDVVLGTHSHMLHQVDYDPLTGQLVAYSLGDFYGEANRAGTDYSIILDLEITRDNVSGETKVTKFSYTPIYTLTEADTADGQRRVVRLEQTLKAYDDNFVDRVSKEVYDDMTYVLTRINDRVTPKPAETEE